jgi:hypothetical protein
MAGDVQGIKLVPSRVNLQQTPDSYLKKPKGKSLEAEAESSVRIMQAGNKVADWAVRGARKGERTVAGTFSCVDGMLSPLSRYRCPSAFSVGRPTGFRERKKENDQ